MKVCFETFGCRLNKAEALQMEAEYLAKGWVLTANHREADLFVVRGCSVTARAERECEKCIAHLRHHYPNIPVRVFGCLKSAQGLPAAIDRRRRSMALDGGRPSATATDRSQPTEPPLPMRTARAYLKVQDGCSAHCAFCIVPKFRGPSVSVPFADVIGQASRFVDAGYHELVVTGCNLTHYASEGRRLPDLVDALAALSADCRIRLGSIEPGAVARETVDAMADHANVCRFLHVSVQSGSNRVLMAMQRPYLAADVDALIEQAERRMPHLGLGCDLMTGFPDESDVDFTATKLMLERLKFNLAHVFPYSERPGTVAATLGNPVAKNVRSSRAHTLARVADAARVRYAQSFIGKTVEIVVERDKACVGRTSEYLVCDAVGSAKRKTVARIFVTSTEGSQLHGRIAGKA